MKRNLRSMFFCIFLLSLANISFANNTSSFFDQRYRGWIWFEEKEKQTQEEKTRAEAKKAENEKLLRAKAREEIEKFAKELEELKYMMIANPKSTEHMRAYKAKEKIMMDNAIILAETARLTNFKHPDLVDHIENPINLYGRKIKEEMDQKNTDHEITELASKVELFLFFAGSCGYCKQLEPVLNDFITKYKFKIEAISLDGAESKFFKTHHDITLAQKLNLEKVPAVYVITNDGKERFELIRGAASFTELEEMALLAAKHLKNLKEEKTNN